MLSIQTEQHISALALGVSITLHSLISKAVWQTIEKNNWLGSDVKEHTNANHGSHSSEPSLAMTQ